MVRLHVAVFGTLPVAMSRCEPSAGSPFWPWTAILPPFISAFFTANPRRTSCSFENSSVNLADTSSSSFGRRRTFLWSIVTFEPIEPKKWASSHEM
jgi:hypothetical protein